MCRTYVVKKKEMEKKTKYKVSAIASLVVALVYLIAPIDLVPDAVPAIGWIDDIIAILVAITNAIRLASKIRKS